MKKLLLVLLFFGLTFPVFSQEQIGVRLIYRVNNGNITITDMYDGKYLTFRLENVINDTFHINCYGTSVSGRIGTGNINTDEFTSIISQYITSWSINNGGNREWQQYAALIADKVRGPRSGQNPAPQASTPPESQPRQSNGSIPLIRNFQTGMYYVQIGAYSNVEIVYSEIAKLDNNLPKAVMQTTVRIHGIERNVNRLLIGPLNYADSVSVLQRFRINYYDAFVWFGR